jgi:hypothetical protein
MSGLFGFGWVLERSSLPAWCAARTRFASMQQRRRPAFQRLAIMNRGEPAMRLINAVRE